MSPSVWFSHPSVDERNLVAPYRRELFAALERRLGFRFLFVGPTGPGQDHSGLRDFEVLPGRGLGPYKTGVSGSLLKAASRGDYDVWISSIVNWWPTHAAWPLVRARRKPFVLWMEDWWWPATRGASLVKIYGRRILHGAHALIVAGSKARTFAIDNGADEGRVFVAYNSTSDLGARSWDESEVAALRSTFTEDPNAFVFLYLNRIVAYKGLDVLLRAFKEVETANPEAWLVVCGEGPEAPACVQLARDLALNNVRFVDAVAHERVHLIYRGCDLYVHPCRFLEGERVKAEAWGFTVNEAMSVGVPVLATTAVAAAHDLIDASTGFIAEPNNVAALKSQMLYAIAHRAELGEMGKKAIEKVSTFTPEGQSAGFERALEHVRR